MYAYLLKDMYDKNPEKTIEQYAKFLECNASLSLDESSKVLFDDKNMTTENVVKNFVKSLDKKTEKMIDKQETKSM